MVLVQHFCVTALKTPALAGAFEREAIRPFVAGRFADMLSSVVKHPAMITYLDNQHSAGPNSEAGRSKRRGLNENLAREILELHTVGVDAGYTQADVVALAKVISGWTVVPVQAMTPEAGEFWFDKSLHEPGPQVLLGHKFAEGGVDQGELLSRRSHGRRSRPRTSQESLPDTLFRMSPRLSSSIGWPAAFGTTMVTCSSLPECSCRHPKLGTVNAGRSGDPANGWLPAAVAWQLFRRPGSSWTLRGCWESRSGSRRGRMDFPTTVLPGSREWDNDLK